MAASRADRAGRSGSRDGSELAGAFDRYGDELAAIIVEPYPANVGLIFPHSGYLETMRDLCTKHGTILIFDEVMTGFRVAPGGVQEKTGVIPDLTALGKIIGGGLAGPRIDLAAGMTEFSGLLGFQIQKTRPD